MDKRQFSVVEIPLTRRRFTLRACSVTLIPVASLLAALPRNTAAATVDESSPQAKALKYASNSTTPGQKCGNCTLYQGQQGQSQGQCPLFSESRVRVNAWCSAWVPRA